MSRHFASVVSDGYRCTRTGPECEPRPRGTSSQDHLIFAGQKPFGEPATVTDRANGYRCRIQKPGLQTGTYESARVPVLGQRARPAMSCWCGKPATESFGIVAYC